MTEVVRKHRRRWLWVIPTIGFVTLGMLAWRFWPNATERKLLGTWRCREYPTETVTFQVGQRMTRFHNGNAMTKDPEYWWVTDQTLWSASRVRQKPLRWNNIWPYFLQLVRSPERPVPQPIEFIAADQLRITIPTGSFPTPLTWERVP